VTPGDDARRLLGAATIMCKITSGAATGKYGPYLKTATDGRQTVSASNQAYVLLDGYDVTNGDKAVAGLWMGCVFDTSEIVGQNAISDNSTMRTALKTAFPLAYWD